MLCESLGDPPIQKVTGTNPPRFTSVCKYSPTMATVGSTNYYVQTAYLIYDARMYQSKLSFLSYPLSSSTSSVQTSTCRGALFSTACSAVLVLYDHGEC